MGILSFPPKRVNSHEITIKGKPVMTEIKFSNHKRVIQTQEILGHGPSYEDQLLGSRVLHEEKEFSQRSAPMKG